MPGKYAALRKKFPAFEEESSYEQKKSIAKQQLLGTLDGAHANVERLAALSVERDSRRAALESCEWSQGKPCGACVYCLKLEVRALSKLMVDVLLDRGEEKIELSNGGVVKLDDKPYPSVKKDDRAAVIEWCFTNHPEMLAVTIKGLETKRLATVLDWLAKREIEFSLDVNTNSFNAMVNEGAADGKPLPPHVNMFVDTQAKVKV